MHIVSVYGDNRSGKNYISEELGRRLPDFAVYETSLPLRRFTDALHALNTVHEDENEKDSYRHLLTQISRAASQVFSRDIWVELSLLELKDRGVACAIINGSRIPSMAHIHELGGLNVWIEASREVIAERYLSKGIILTEEMYNNGWDDQIRAFKHDKSLFDLWVRNDNDAKETEKDVEVAVQHITEHFRLNKN